MAEMTLDGLAAFFERIAGDLEHYDPTPVLTRLRPALERQTLVNFALAQSPEGIPWAPRKVPAPRPLLVLSGDLLRGVLTAARQAVVSRDGLSFNVDVLPPYWPHHQFGTRRMPARPFLGMGGPFLTEVEEALAEDLLGRVLS